MHPLELRPTYVLKVFYKCESVLCPQIRCVTVPACLYNCIAFNNSCNRLFTNAHAKSSQPLLGYGPQRCIFLSFRVQRFLSSLAGDSITASDGSANCWWTRQHIVLLSAKSQRSHDHFWSSAHSGPMSDFFPISWGVCWREKLSLTRGRVCLS
jgi:hypothetical protein